MCKLRRKMILGYFSSPSYKVLMFHFIFYPLFSLPPDRHSTHPTTTEWASQYPQGKADPNKLPQDWVDALNGAVSAGKIPNIPPSKLVNGNPQYPNNLDPNGATVCSTTAKCNKNPDVWWDAPDGVFATSFDDGPLPVRHFSLSSQPTR